MAQQIRTLLKSYFESGDVPTEAQFADLIDSLLNIADDDLDDIAEGTTNKHVTAAEKSAWNGKQDAMGADDNYVTDAEKAVIGNTSGVNTGDEPSASSTEQGVVELAIASEVDAGSDAGRAITPDALAGSSIFGVKAVEITVFNYTADCATGDGKAYFVVPSALNGMNLVGVHGRAITAGTTNTMDVQIRNVTDSVDMLSTKLTWNSGGVGTDTATPAVIDNTKDDVATYDLLAIDVDAVQTTPAKGMIITLLFQKP